MIKKSFLNLYIFSKKKLVQKLNSKIKKVKIVEERLQKEILPTKKENYNLDTLE